MAEWLEALAWRLSQPGFDPSYGKILFSHTDEFWLNETDLSADDYIYRRVTGSDFARQPGIFSIHAATGLKEKLNKTSLTSFKIDTVSHPGRNE